MINNSNNNYCYDNGDNIIIITISHQFLEMYIIFLS